ncbi:hypothetical protein CCYA_CCYA02G0544 [Cyanidiococcus yangmingshanensis]|nr:hypothetical protein CCYA_CCYA02G0544 [Cyanidiococcus yangmingshanensis]
MTFPRAHLGRIRTCTRQRRAWTSRVSPTSSPEPPADAARWVERLCQMASAWFCADPGAAHDVQSRTFLWYSSPCRSYATDRSRTWSVEADGVCTATMVLSALVEEAIYSGALLGVHLVGGAAQGEQSVQGNSAGALWCPRPVDSTEFTPISATLSSMLQYDALLVTRWLLAEIQQRMGMQPMIHISDKDLELVAALRKLVRFRLVFDSCWKRARQYSRCMRRTNCESGQPACTTPSVISSPTAQAIQPERMLAEVSVSTAWIQDTLRLGDVHRQSHSMIGSAAVDFLNPVQPSNECYASVLPEAQSRLRQPQSMSPTASQCEAYPSVTTPEPTRYPGNLADATCSASDERLSLIPETRVAASSPQDSKATNPFPPVELCTPREVEELESHLTAIQSPASAGGPVRSTSAETIPRESPQSARAFFAAVLARYGEAFLMEQLCTGSGTGMVGSERHKLSRHAEAVLTDHYERVSVYPSASEREQLARKTGLNRKQICWWFSNRRMREKRGRLGRRRSPKHF